MSVCLRGRCDVSELAAPFYCSEKHLGSYFCSLRLNMEIFIERFVCVLAVLLQAGFMLAESLHL